MPVCDWVMYQVGALKLETREQRLLRAQWESSLAMSLLT